MKLWAVLLVACGSARPVELANSQTAATTDGCPGAADVWIASSESDHGRERWVVPVHHEMLQTEAGVAAYEKIDEAAARAHGVARAPARLWLMFPDQPPCEATPAGYYAELISEGPINHTYGFELATACKADVALAVAIAAPAAPASCKTLVARDVANRLGSADQAGWHRPIAQTAIPAVLQRALPPHACTPPDCEALWAVTELRAADTTVLYEPVRSWVTIPKGSTPDHQCDWAQDQDYGIYLMPHGAPARLDLAGDVASHRVFAVLADARGPRVLVTANIGEYATWDWGNPPRRSRYEKWMEPNEEDYAGQGALGPYCGP